MKRFISVIISLCLIFGSFSFVFGAVSDSQASSIVSDLSTIRSTLNNIYTRLGTIQGYLFDSGHSVAYWVSAINSWMQPIYTSLTSGLASSLNFEPIIAGLNEVVSSGGATSYIPYLKYGDKSNSHWLSDLYTLDSVNGFESQAGGTSVTVFTLAPGGTYTSSTINFSRYGWRSSVATMLLYINNNIARGFRYQNDIAFSSYGNSQSALNWLDLSTQTFSPNSATSGIYQWLSAIQAPVARLSYVLASDQRIEAQQASSANEQSVVDNFIDSSGSGSVSASDFGSVSGASKSFRDNFNSGVSASGVWSVFNQNYDWFSQSTADALDTSSVSSSARRLKSASSVRSDTPLLDAYYSDLFDIIGVINDD